MQESTSVDSHGTDLNMTVPVLNMAVPVVDQPVPTEGKSMAKPIESAKKRKKPSESKPTKRIKTSQVSSYQWKIEFTNGQILKNIFDIIRTAVFASSTWIFKADHVKCLMTDDCNVSFAECYIRSCPPYVEYTAPTNVSPTMDDADCPMYKINTEFIKSFVKTLRPTDHVTWYAQNVVPRSRSDEENEQDDSNNGPDKLDIQVMTEDGVKHHRVNLMKLTGEELTMQASRVDAGSPPVDLFSVNMSSSTWRNYISSVGQSNRVHMTIRPDMFVLQTKSDYGESTDSFTTESKAVEITCPNQQACRLTFNTKYLTQYSNGYIADTRVLIRVNDKRPIWIKYDFTIGDEGNKSTFGSINYYLAPMSEDDME
jgi:hypothetical protein